MRVSAMPASGILWILFILYWSAAARNTGPTISAESVASRQVHQLLMYGALALGFVRPPLLDRRFLPSFAFLVLLGFAVQIGAMALAVWARKHLGRNWSGAITTKSDHQLVRSGPYHRVRHPIYSGMLGMFLGTTLISGEWHALLGLVVISVAYLRKIRLEEQRLGEVFGEEYGQYRRASWAVIPGLL